LPSGLGTSANDDSLQQTSIALGVQSTSNALREATLQALETVASVPTTAPVVEVDLQATLNAQMTAIASQATPEAPEASPTSESAPPTEPPSAPEEIVLQKWKAMNLVEGNSCEYKDGLPCWVGSGIDITLESSEPILVDANWERPYLVFSHNYSFEGDGFVYVNPGGRWEVLRSYPKGQVRWTDVALDLSKYKGKEILLKFFTSGPTIKHTGPWWKPDKAGDASRWSILNIRLIPNYSS